MRSMNEYDLASVVRCLPAPLVDMLKKQGKSLFVAGGFIRAIVANERWNDIDLFCGDKAVAETLAKQLGKTFDTDNAYSVRVMGQQVQFIHRWTFSDPASCLDSFDFTIAKAAVWFDQTTGWNSACDDSFYTDLAAKRLVYCSPKREEEAGGSMLRVLKFYQRGYRIPLDSLGAVMSRMVMKIDFEKITATSDEAIECRVAKILTSLLYEVDPNAMRVEYFIKDINQPNPTTSESP